MGIDAAVYEKDPSYRIRIDSDGIAALTPGAFAVFAATAGNPGPRMDTFDHRLNLLHRRELPACPGVGTWRSTG